VQQVVRGGGGPVGPGCRARVSWDPSDIHLVQADG
jgi:hypothetical protein